MVKRLLLFLLLLAGSISLASAQWKGLAVQQADGTTITIALTEHPTIYFEGNNIVIRTNSGGEYSLSPSQEFKANFSESTSGIETVLKERHLSLEGDYLVLSGQKAGVKVLVYTIGGRLTTESSTDANGHAVVDLNALPKGVYLIKTPSLTQKILKK